MSKKKKILNTTLRSICQLPLEVKYEQVEQWVKDASSKRPNKLNLKQLFKFLWFH